MATDTATWLSRSVGEVMRHAARRDANEAQIVDYLRRCGVVVIEVSSPGAPDLLCYCGGTWYPIEVKTSHGRLTQRQQVNLAMAPFHVVRSVEEAEQWYQVNCLP